MTESETPDAGPSEPARKSFVTGLGKGSVESAARLTEQMNAHQRSMDVLLRDIKTPGQVQAERDHERAERERQGLELSGRLVEQQRLLVETQQATLDVLRQQQADAERDRIFQRAVLLVAVIAVVAPTVATVAVASHSWFWSFFAFVASSIAMGLLCLLVTSERRKRADIT